MKESGSRLRPAVLTIGLAAILWFITFSVPVVNFWIKISISSSVLAIVAWRLKRPDEMPFRLNLGTVAIGLASAVALYIVFLTGRAVSHLIFPFAGDQIHGIYSMGEGMPVWVIALLLFFITGPAEEIYWRGFLQERLIRRFGGWQGWLMASGIYAGVHICSWNFMLVGAAGVAGLFWGLLYWRLNNLVPLIISHAVWSTVIFAVFPTT